MNYFPGMKEPKFPVQNHSLHFINFMSFQSRPIKLIPKMIYMWIKRIFLAPHKRNPFMKIYPNIFRISTAFGAHFGMTPWDMARFHSYNTTLFKYPYTIQIHYVQRCNERVSIKKKVVNDPPYTFNAIQTASEKSLISIFNYEYWLNNQSRKHADCQQSSTWGHSGFKVNAYIVYIKLLMMIFHVTICVCAYNYIDVQKPQGLIMGNHMTRMSVNHIASFVDDWSFTYNGLWPARIGNGIREFFIFFSNRH